MSQAGAHAAASAAHDAARPTTFAAQDFTMKLARTLC
jgi:hypothetical protein